jgi:hypothetical protein
MVRIVEGRLPPTVAQQAYLIGSGLAQGGANIVLAKGLVNFEDVPRDDLAIGIFISAILTFVPVLFLLKILERRRITRTI